MNVSQLELAQGRMIRIARRIGLSGHVICHRRIEFETLEPRLTLSAVAAHMLVDVAPGAANSSPRDFTSSNNAVYFLADESPQASDLWKTNGADQSSLVSQQTSTGSVTVAAEAVAAVGSANFPMYTQNDGAWVKNAAEENRLVEAMRKGADLVVKATTSRGTQTSDTFSLKGISQALDRAAQECK